MDDLLEKLYQHFYTQPVDEPLKQRIEANHQRLIQKLSKDEAILLMHVMDDKDLLTTEVSMDSFIRGFQLAQSLFHQLNEYRQTST